MTFKAQSFKKCHSGEKSPAELKTDRVRLFVMTHNTKN